MEEIVSIKDKSFKSVKLVDGLNRRGMPEFKFIFSRIKVLKAVEVKLQGRPGEILSNEFIIACQKNAIQILELKKEGKNKMKVQEYTNGNKLEVGTLINE